MTKLLAESAGHIITKRLPKYDLQLSRRVQIVTVPVTAKTAKKLVLRLLDLPVWQIANDAGQIPITSLQHVQ